MSNLCGDRLPLVRQLPPLRPLDDLHDLLDHLATVGTLRVSATCALDVLSGCVRLLPSR
jgi:hypothetical protein